MYGLRGLNSLGRNYTTWMNGTASALGQPACARCMHALCRFVDQDYPKGPGSSNSRSFVTSHREIAHQCYRHATTMCTTGVCLCLEKEKSPGSREADVLSQLRYQNFKKTLFLRCLRHALWRTCERLCKETTHCGVLVGLPPFFSPLITIIKSSLV